MSEQLVGAVPGDVLGTLADIMLKLKNGGLTSHELKRFAKRQNPFGPATGNLRYDKRKEGWYLLENVPRSINGPVVGIPFHKDGENCVIGADMFRRARVELNADFSQEDAEWLLDSPNMLPEDEADCLLLFTATLWWRHGAFGAYVPGLVREGGRPWELKLDNQIEGGFYYRICRLPAPSK